MSPLIEIIIALVLVGVIVWVVQTLLPIPPPFKTAILAIVGLILILWLLQLLGVFTFGHSAVVRTP